MSVKEARLLEGKVLAASIQQEIKNFVDDLRQKRKEIPRLAALETSQDGGTLWYLGQQAKLAGKLGIEFERIKNVNSQKILEERIEQFSSDSACHGIFVAMPLPKEMNADRALLLLNGMKDVEGITPSSLGLIVLRKSKLIPSTAYAAYRLIESTGVKLRGLRAAVIGQSAIVGRPLNLLLGEQRVTTTVCNTGTSDQDLEQIVSESDLVVACAGKPRLVKGSWIKNGAIVIDVGTTEVDGKLVGDVEFEEARARAGYITPVPGGVGPLTVTMLMQNLIHAYKWQKGIPS